MVPRPAVTKDHFANALQQGNCTSEVRLITIRWCSLSNSGKELQSAHLSLGRLRLCNSKSSCGLANASLMLWTVCLRKFNSPFIVFRRPTGVSSNSRKFHFSILQSIASQTQAPAPGLEITLYDSVATTIQRRLHGCHLDEDETHHNATLAELRHANFKQSDRSADSDCRSYIYQWQLSIMFML